MSDLYDYKTYFKKIVKIGNINLLPENIVYKYINDLLKILPNEGRLYKYRSFSSNQFDNNYKSIKDKYLYFPTANNLNDDIDTTIQYDEERETAVMIDYAYSHPVTVCRDLYFSDEYNNRFGKTLVQKLIYKLAFSSVNNDNVIDKSKFVNRMKNHGINEIKSIQYANNIEMMCKSFILKTYTESDVKNVIKKYNEMMRVDFSVFSLSSSYDLDNMWALYSNNNLGYCIEYDFNKLLNYDYSLQKYFIKTLQVLYSDQRETFKFDDLIDNYYSICNREISYLNKEWKASMIKTNEQIIKILMTKKVCWEQEREWRIINVGIEKNKIPVDLVSKVYIDKRCLDKSNQTIYNNSIKLMKLLQGRDIPIIFREINYIKGCHEYIKQ